MVQIDLTLTLANTNYNLFTLIAAAKATSDSVWVFDECKQLEVQMDPADVAGSTYRRGTSALSDTVFGAQFVAGDFDTWGPLDTGGIFLSDFNYRCSSAGKILRVSAVLR